MLRACIIGTGRIASSLEKDPLRPPGCTHAGCYSLNPATELVAGADIDPAALASFGDDWNLPAERLYRDYRQMLAAESPDLASVCAYAPQRLEMALAALEAGAKGLWLEKALGCSLEEAEQIETALRKRGAAGVVDYPRRGRAAYRTIKSLIDAGTFGTLQSVTCHMTHQLIHTGTHAFDVLDYWCGEMIAASGTLEIGPSDDGRVRDQGGSGEMVFRSGVRAFISAYRKKYYIFQFDLIFEDARILIGNDIAKVYRPATSKNYSGFKELFEMPDFDWGKPYRRSMLDELIHCVKTGDAPLFSIANATTALRMALTLFESAKRGGAFVRPEEIDPTLRIENH